MIHHFNVTGEDRKNLVKAVSVSLGIPAKYLGAPTFAYQFGSYKISKDGELSWTDLDDADPVHLEQSTKLLQDLQTAGYHSDEMTFAEEQNAAIEADNEVHGDEINTHGIDQVPDEPALSISLPRERFDEAAIENLKALIISKGTLMKRAFQTGDLPLIITDEKVTFSWFRMGNSEETAAYTAFIQAIGEMAVNQKRISSKVKEITNEKYEFRCFLLRLGMIGDDTKQIRKTLLKNLSGSSAFKSGAKKDGEQT